MAIDRIGKSNLTVPASSPTGTEGASRPFAVREPGAVGNTRAVAPAASPALERLRAGEINAPTYLDVQVQDATAHLRGMRPDALHAIQRMLRDGIVTDPALASLAHQVTGQAPTLPSEENDAP